MVEGMKQPHRSSLVKRQTHLLQERVAEDEKKKKKMHHKQQWSEIAWKGLMKLKS